MVLKYLIPLLAGIAFIGAGGIQKTVSLFKGSSESATSSPSSPVSGSTTINIPNAVQPSDIPIQKTENQQQTDAYLNTLKEISKNNSKVFDLLQSGQATAKTVSVLPKEQRKIAQKEIETFVVANNPVLTSNTSLPNAAKTTGRQLKREEPVVITNAKKTNTASSSKLQMEIARQQTKAEELFAKLYGTVTDSKFKTGGK